MRRRPFAVLVALIVVVRAFALDGTVLAQGQTPSAPVRGPATAPTRQPVSTDLPVTAIALFSSGVGYFEHVGSVRGDASTELRFRTAQMNDVLKSLVANDLGGGLVTGVSYPTQDPLSKTLRSFQIDVAANPSVADLLTQLRGSRASVVWRAERLSGTIFGVELRRRTTERGETAVEAHLNLVTAAGIRSVPIGAITSFRLDDPVLQQELTRALAAVSQARDQDRKSVNVAFAGTGDRRVRIGYVVETPVWKTSYRLTLDEASATLQGWALVDNQTEGDWNNVSLSLVSGRPSSFTMDLYQPLYSSRPSVVPEMFARLRPQSYASGIETTAERVPLGTTTIVGSTRDAATGAPVPHANVEIPSLGMRVLSDERGAYRIPGISIGAMLKVQATRVGYGMLTKEVRADQPLVTLDLLMNTNVTGLNAVVSSATGGDPTTGVRMPFTMNPLGGDQTPLPSLSEVAQAITGKVAGVGINPYSGAPGDSSNVQIRAIMSPFRDASGAPPTTVTTRKLGELFQYAIPNVTLARQKSAMLPIVGDTVGVDRVAIYNASVLASNPVSGVRIRNTTGKHLMQGPITVLDNGSYAGDARIDDLPPGQERLISYGIDLDMTVQIARPVERVRIEGARIDSGVLRIDRRRTATIEYNADNKSTRNKLLVVEHPIRVGWNLGGTFKPLESTQTLHRFQGLAVAGKVSTLSVVEEQMAVQRMSLAILDTVSLRLLIVADEMPATVREALKGALAHRIAVAKLEHDIQGRTVAIAMITAEQNRIRENMRTITSGTAYYKRLVAKLNEQESKIEAIQNERDALYVRRDRAKVELDAFVAALTIS